MSAEDTTIVNECFSVAWSIACRDGVIDSSFCKPALRAHRPTRSLLASALSLIYIPSSPSRTQGPRAPPRRALPHRRRLVLAARRPPPNLALRPSAAARPRANLPVDRRTAARAGPQADAPAPPQGGRGRVHKGARRAPGAARGRPQDQTPAAAPGARRRARKGRGRARRPRAVGARRRRGVRRAPRRGARAPCGGDAICDAQAGRRRPKVQGGGRLPKGGGRQAKVRG